MSAAKKCCAQRALVLDRAGEVTRAEQALQDAAAIAALLEPDTE